MATRGDGRLPARRQTDRGDDGTVDASCPWGVQAFLTAWQGNGADDDFSHLWSLVSATVEHDAVVVLRRCGVRDPAAVDESMSLVMDHLRRLPLGTVRRFDPRRHEGRDGASAYIRWLSQRRARDIVRQRRRQVPTFTDIAATDRLVPDTAACCDEGPSADPVASLVRAMDQLDPRSRQVLEWLLAGRTQVQISRDLGVCEGTVTRIRQKALDRLRECMLAAAPLHDAVG